MKKIRPLHLAHNAIDQAFQVLLEHSLCEYADEVSGGADDHDLIKCFEILRDARIRLDNVLIEENEKMLKTKDAKTQKIERELAACEKSYVALARMNPQSINGTQRHFTEIDKVVRDMKCLRRRLCRSTDDTFLRELLYPTGSAEMNPQI